MDPKAKSAAKVGSAIFNLPNQLTMLRLIVSVALFCLICYGQFVLAFIFFVVGAGTDWLDGYFARKYGQVTVLGRILDPFADKVIICGTFILLASIPEINALPWGLRAWMVVVIVGRELLVTTLRSFIEERGGDFSAKWSGKIKMGVQCFNAGACLVFLSFENPVVNSPQWVQVCLIGSTWLSMASTIYSGGIYVGQAIKQIKE